MGGKSHAPGQRQAKGPQAGGTGPTAGQGRGNSFDQEQVRQQADTADYDSVYARWRAVVDSVTCEDSTTGDRPAKPAEQRVGTQLREQLDAAATAQVAASRPGGDVGGFDRAVAALERAYAASSLYSTDPAVSGPWEADATRDELGSATVDAKIAGWQQQSGLGAVKFAVPRPGPDGQTRVRVGWGTSHVAIAGGPAVAAGLLRFDLRGARPTATELENVSGGFRPGPLRNAVARAAVEAAGYATDLHTHAKADGTYGGSWMETNPAR